MSRNDLKGARKLEHAAKDLAQKLDDAIREEFFGYLIKLRSEAKRIDLKIKVAEEAREAASLVVSRITEVTKSDHQE